MCIVHDWGQAIRPLRTAAPVCRRRLGARLLVLACGAALAGCGDPVGEHAIDGGTSTQSTTPGGGSPSAKPSVSDGPYHEPSGMATQINTGAISSTTVVTVYSPSAATATGERRDNLSTVPGGTGLRVTYPTSVVGGNSPVRFGVAIPSAGTGWYYQRMKIRFSSNWTTSGNFDVKICEPRTQQFGDGSGATENHNISAHGPTTKAFLFVGLQGPNGHFGNLTEQPANTSDADLAGGSWHTMEVLFTPESKPGAGNGSYTAWVDGTQIAHYTSVQWLASGNEAGWPFLMFDPTYGGGTNSPSSTMYWDFDQLYVSTK